MDFGRRVMHIRTQRMLRVLVFALGVQAALTTQGCHDDMPVPAVGQLEEFSQAGPTGPAVDTGRLVKARLQTGPHRVVPGEVLELTMPSILRVVTAEQTGPAQGMEDTPFVCRVSPAGTIVLPIVGEMPVAGRTLAEIESGVARAYYPAYAKTYPSVFARVLEYDTHKVTITGAVNKPGIYELRSDQMSLVSLIMAAEGIVDDGAGLIRITRSQAAGETSDLDHVTGPSAYPSGSGLQDTVPLGSAGLDPDLRVSFRPLQQSGTLGTLVVARGLRVLASEELDLASDVQRRRVLSQIAAADPGVSAKALDRQLSRLVAVIHPADPAGDRAAFASATVDDRSTGMDIRPTASVAEGIARAAAQGTEPLVGRAYNGPGDNPAQGPDQTIVLPVKGMSSIPFVDVALQEGDSVEVDRLVIPVFTVLGLVTKPGTFEYPPNMQYNLMQAIGMAGGLEGVPDPRYAMVYRLKQDGGIACMPFEIANPDKKGEIAVAMGVLIKPGDIIEVEHTPRTRTNAFIERIFNVNVGAYIPLYR
ncbi:MAG: SLBB domain-containing protein [Phycisphaerae bacterium]|nr:SLBB domain-containing protein [Phycisphaerae bacterium]